MSYYNGSAYTFAWEGRRLVGAVNGSTTMSFTYNDDGIRTSKTVSGVTHTYYLNGTQIVAEEWGDKLLVYLYDASGAPIGMMYRKASYSAGTFDVFWFEKNLQGDIIAVYNSDGVACVTYKYDAWGNCTESDILTSGTNVYATSNPFRYRGYYYDTDLGMYYLQSRYYDAKICRFINADRYISTGQGLTGYNMFAYCGNNPVNRVDPNGEGWIGVIVLTVFIVVALTGCSSQQPTQEQVDRAKEAANNAKFIKNSDGSSIDIYIDLSDKSNHFDEVAYDEYLDQLYDNMIAKAKAEEIPIENLMSRDHIEWEYNVHRDGYNLAIEAFKEPCREAHLNVGETWGTLISRGLEYLIND